MSEKKVIEASGGYVIKAVGTRHMHDKVYPSREEAERHLKHMALMTHIEDGGETSIEEYEKKALEKFEIVEVALIPTEMLKNIGKMMRISVDEDGNHKVISSDE